MSEDYIVQESYKTDTFCREKYLLKGLGVRNLHKFYFKYYELAQDELNKMKFQNDEYFDNRYELDVEYITYTTAELVYSKTDIIHGWHDKMIGFFLVKI